MVDISHELRHMAHFVPKRRCAIGWKSAAAGRTAINERLERKLPEQAPTPPTIRIWIRMEFSQTAAAALVACTFVLAVAPGCARESGAAPDETRARSIAEHYAEGAHRSYALAAESADALASAVKSFVGEPTASSLAVARKSWIKAHRTYSLTEVFRFYDGPIDNPTSGPEGMINAWPLDEAYIDYVDGDDGAGIINKPELYPEITTNLLVSMNEKDGEKNISTGFHAVEFLLWGQDKSTSGPGERSVADYDASNPRAERRSRYLQLTSQLLARHLRAVADEWKPGEANYRAAFTAAPPQDALRKIFAGMAMLAGDELSKERMAVPLETTDQEDEQSCFSDTTLIDLRQNLASIRRVYTGEYPRAKGPGPASLVAQAAPEADVAVRAKWQAAHAALNDIPEPFDAALGSPDGREKINGAVAAVEEFSTALVAAAEAVGLKINLK